MAKTETKPTYDARDLSDEKLRAKRETLATEIRRLTDQFESNGKQWKGDEQRQTYDQANADYDAAYGELVRREDACKIAARDIALGSQPYVSDVVTYRPGDEVHSGNNIVGPAAQGMVYETADCRQQRALTRDESLAKRCHQATADFMPQENVNVGRPLHVLVSERFDRMTDTERRGVFGGIDPQGGYLLTPFFGGQLLDLARSASVVMRAGAQTLPMDQREVSIVKKVSDPTAMWRAEGQETLASDMTFSVVKLRARTLAAIIPITVEMAEDSVNSQLEIEKSLRDAMGAELDRAALLGIGSESEPLGITNTDGLNTVAVSGVPANYSKWSEAIGKIVSANRPDIAGLSSVMNPDVAGVLDRLVDSTGQPLQKSDWVRGLQSFNTTKLPVATALVGDFNQVLVGMRTTGVRVRIADAGQVTDITGQAHNALSEFKRFLIAFMRADVCVLRPSWLCSLTGITTS